MIKACHMRARRRRRHGRAVVVAAGVGRAKAAASERAGVASLLPLKSILSWEFREFRSLIVEAN